MKKNNGIFQNSIALKFVIWVFLIIFLFALLTNFLMLCHNPFKIDIAGNPSDWIGFYAGAFSSAISSVVAFIILIYNYKQNEKNHSELKKIQINSISYQETKTRLDKINEELFELYESVSPDKLRYFLFNSVVFEEFDYQSCKFNYVTIYEDLIQKEKRIIFISEINSDIIKLSRTIEQYIKCKKIFNSILKDIRLYIKKGEKEQNEEMLFGKRIEDLMKEAAYIDLYKEITKSITMANKKMKEKFLTV